MVDAARSRASVSSRIRAAGPHVAHSSGGSPCGQLSPPPHEASAGSSPRGRAMSTSPTTTTGR